ncbi:uncharacterized protein LOC9660588 [Selaginella moellendorffii]|uniref:uncharacterized protein LOC9660588 n=1 Tax=Selaginella moellendorffii TaxID=88036 RepID=UPI000D1C5D5F|nr:uncharacterized protein LOC9660588 [Selaginella moellendorffii]|eukprot:XP_024520580.1 uncharacterized protein LOC9660588 [Selaginella moellendorffii]
MVFHEQGATSIEMESPFSPAGAAPSSGSLREKSVRKPSPPPPEHELILVALRLSVLEKAASGLGVVAFVWATVVLLGGFVTSLEARDFWIISVLLLTEGTRVFSRSHELEWQQAAPRISIRTRAKSIINHTRPTIFGSSSQPDLVPAHKPETKLSDKNSSDQGASFFTANRISALLYVMQLASALVCVGLSVTRLSTAELSGISTKNKNQDYALGIFYSLVLAEALIFLAERAYWEFQVGYKGLVSRVTRECRLGTDQIDNVKRFYYEVYSDCLKGSVFDGLGMDLVAYGMDDLQENNAREQLGGACILLAFLEREDLAEETMRRIGTKPGVIERLIEMLTWKEKYEEDIQRVAAQIVCQVACQKSVSE